MLLSKYTAAVTVMGMLYIVFSKQRQLFKSMHFYLASLVIILMVAPVIYWNANHNWVSITYLLNFHSQTQNNTTAAHSLLVLLGSLLINYSVFLLFAAWGWFKYRQTKNSSDNPVLELTYTVLFVGLLFWIIATLLGGDTRAVYLTPLGMNLALITGFNVARYHYQRFFMIVYPFFLTFSILVIIVNSWPIATYLKKDGAYTVLKKAINAPEIIKKDNQ